jgi:hypothetical protein
MRTRVASACWKNICKYCTGVTLLHDDFTSSSTTHRGFADFSANPLESPCDSDQIEWQNWLVDNVLEPGGTKWKPS